MLTCKFCCKECKNNNSLRNHEPRCKSNPEQKLYGFGADRSCIKESNRTNQYIRARNLGLPKPIVSDAVRQKLSDAIAKRTPEWNKENGKKIAVSVNKRVADGTWHTSLAKNMHIDYNGIDLHGSWELAYVKYLDENSILWKRCKESFTYYFDGKNRKYTPDFYLIDTDEYVEIKGYKTEKDIAKWAQFPKYRKLTILMKSELKQMKILC